jgi:hypothetical protein
VRVVPSWPREIAVAQVLAAILAFYIAFSAWRSQTNLPVALVALTLGVVGVRWVLRLGKAAKLYWTRAATVIVALFPLAGLAQFWLQTDYLPKTTLPQVDVSTDLSEVGRTGPTTIILSAKVTLHNRGTVAVDMIGGLFRVTAHQSRAPAGSARGKAERAANLIPPEFRLAGRDAGTVLPPGETETIQHDVPIDRTQVALARLTYEAVFLTQRGIVDITACADGSSLIFAPDSFPDALQHPHGDWAGVSCVDYELEPTNVIEALVTGRQPTVGVAAITGDGSKFGNFPEYPQALFAYSSRGRPPQQAYRQGQDFGTGANANPLILFVNESAEYVPTDLKPPSGVS